MTREEADRNAADRNAAEYWARLDAQPEAEPDIVRDPPKPKIENMLLEFEEHPTTETLARIIRSCEAYCLRTKHPRFNQAALAAVVAERAGAPIELLHAALKAEACYDAWISL